MKHGKFFTDINGESIELAAFVRDAGENLICFLHGLACSKDSFRHFWNRTDFQGYSVLALDLVGFGQSAKPESFSYTMEAQAHVCSEILTKFSDRKLHIVAHSMGGAVALLLLDEILNRAESFVSVEGNMIGADCGIMSRRIMAIPFEKFGSIFFPVLKDKFSKFGEKYTAIEDSSAAAVHRSSKSLVEWSESNKLLERFLELPCRKAYFFGEKSAEHPVMACTGDILKVKIKQSSHFPMNDNPGDFYDELFKFIAGADLA